MSVPEEKTTQIIAIGALKGGTGKTSVTFNLASVLAEDKNVLLIDKDPQANLSSDVGVDIADQKRLSIRNIYEDNSIKPSEVIIKQPIHGLPGLDIIPSHIKLMETERRLANRAGREHILANWLDDNKEELKIYDYIFLDTNPSMSLLNANAFYVADKIILVSDVSPNGVQGIELFLSLWDETRRDLRKENNVAALIINNYASRTKWAKDMMEFCADHEEIKYLLIDEPIPATVKMKDTSGEHCPINLLHPNSGPHKAIKAILKKLMEKGVL